MMIKRGMEIGPLSGSFTGGSPVFSVAGFSVVSGPAGRLPEFAYLFFCLA